MKLEITKTKRNNTFHYMKGESLHSWFNIQGLTNEYRSSLTRREDYLLRFSLGRGETRASRPPRIRKRKKKGGVGYWTPGTRTIERSMEKLEIILEGGRGKGSISTVICIPHLSSPSS